MSAATPVERVVALLQGAGYRSLAMPLTVASMPFEFAAALVGEQRAPDLIVVVDTVLDVEVRVQQKLEALSLALDVAGSRRPLTAVLVGPRPGRVTLESIGRVCRVLPVGTPVGPSGDSELNDRLAILQPLPLPQPSNTLADPIGELRQQMPLDVPPETFETMLKAAATGTANVEDALRDLISRPLHAPMKEFGS